MNYGMEKFEARDYIAWDAKPFPNGDAPLVAQCKNYTLVVGAECGELYDDYELSPTGNDVVLTFDTSHFKSAAEAIKALAGIAECLLIPPTPIPTND